VNKLTGTSSVVSSLYFPFTLFFFLGYFKDKVCPTRAAVRLGIHITGSIGSVQ